MDNRCTICEEPEHTGDCLIPDAPWAKPEPLEACAYCGDLRADHEHGKHMMPFCIAKACQSRYWKGVREAEVREAEEAF